MKKGERAVEITRFAVKQAKIIVEEEFNLDATKNALDFRISVLNITNRIVDLMRGEA